MEQLVELAHLEEQNNIVVLGLELPPLPLRRCLGVEEVLWHMKCVRVVILMFRAVTFSVLNNKYCICVDYICKVLVASILGPKVKENQEIEFNIFPIPITLV